LNSPFPANTDELYCNVISGYGFVHYQNPEDTNKAHQELQGYQLGTRNMVIGRISQNETVPEKIPPPDFPIKRTILTEEEVKARVAAAIMERSPYLAEKILKTVSFFFFF